MPILTKSLRVFDGAPIQLLLEKEGRLVKKNPFEGYHEYLMPPEIASIYGSMKVLFVNCIDRKSKIWDIKKSNSFQKRQRYDSLTEAFFASESLLLEKLINWSQKKYFKLEEVKEVINKIYFQLEEVGKAISLEIKSVALSPNAVAKKIFTLMKEKSWNTFKEEYRGNED